MIGRKKRQRVVFIDGIPIESAILNAGESGIQREDPVLNPAALKELDPRVLFDKYDADGSGGIDFDEFKVLLHDLNIKLSEPKALAYFKRCDKMRRGHISFEEFRLALYTCDPKNPNRTMGFAPGQALSPKDLFEMFDRDEEGAIDRATFIEVLEFLGHKMPLDRMEGIFAAHEDPVIEMMPYYQFKKVWLGLVDVRTELRNRHEKFNRFSTNGALMKKLEILINEEEKQEARMLLEAATTLEEERIAAHRRWLIEESVTLSQLVLAEALDVAGQVYVFGKGAFGRFDGDPIAPDFVDFMDYEIVSQLWKNRVRPSDDLVSRVKQSVDLSSRNDGKDGSVDTSSDDGRMSEAEMRFLDINMKDHGLLTRARMTLDAAARAFAGRQISLIPAFLWGKRVRKVTIGLAVAYALTDSGEVFCWGGSKRQWRYFYDDVTEGTCAGHEQLGSALPVPDRCLTTRTEMLKQTLPSQLSTNQVEHNEMYLRQKYQRTFVKPVRPLPTEDQKRQKLEVLGRYFDIIPTDQSAIDPPDTVARGTKVENSKNKKKSKSDTAPDGMPASTIASSSSRNVPTFQDLMETVEPELNVDDLVVSLEMRGVHMAKQTRMVLVDKLGDCLQLEIECLGEKFHNHMKDLDKAARRAKHDRQEKKLQILLVRANMLWNELRILQEDITRITHDEFVRTEHEYLDMKKKIAQAKQKFARRAREGLRALDGETSLLYLNGLTSRGAPQKLQNGDRALLDISVGSRHALAVHQSGKLYTWGVGSFGRLGGVRTDHHQSTRLSTNSEDDPDAWHRDVHFPQVISSMGDARFRMVCCGFGHSLALTTQGEVFVWGSSSHGKLGIGPVSKASIESFTLSPLRLNLPAGMKVRKLACGPSHSALITTSGALYIWGSGDGGKLGLGDYRDIGEDRVPRNSGNLRVIDAPIRVGGLLMDEDCVDVSCGTAHTVVSTVVHSSAVDGQVTGGRVYVAGSSHALGKFTPVFTLLPLHLVNRSNNPFSSVVIARVSCGNAHTALVSQKGELFTWGNNTGGCTGHPLVHTLIKTPTRVSCMYQCPRNLCLDSGVKVFQSTQNASCIAEFALQRCDDPFATSSTAFAQTQQEICPFWEVTLSSLSRIEQITVVMKRVPSLNTQRSDFSTPMSTKRSISTSSSASTHRTSRSQAATASMKYVVCVSEVSFDKEERGKYSVTLAKSHSVYTVFSFDSDDQSCWKWSVPVDTYGRHVRVQIENGMGMLSLVSVSVVGSKAEEYNGPCVNEVSCGEAITVAICRPFSSVEMIRERFRRAIRADRNNLWILQQLETFHPYVREEIEPRSSQENAACVLCKPKQRCVVCLLDDAVFANEIKQEAERKRAERVEQLRLQLEAEHQRQEDMLRQERDLRRGTEIALQNKHREAERRKAARYAAKAKAKTAITTPSSPGVGKVIDEDPIERLKKYLTLDEKCERLVKLNMRTEEEEEEAEKRLAAEFFAIDPIAAAASQEKLGSKAGVVVQQPSSGQLVSKQSLGVSSMLARLIKTLRRKAQAKAVMDTRSR